MTTSREGGSVVLDTSAYISLHGSGAHDLLRQGAVDRLHMTDTVRDEVREPSQKTTLDALIAEGAIHETNLDDLPGLRRYADLLAKKRNKGKGEWSCLALAEREGWSVMSDDRRARTVIGAALGKQRVFDSYALVRGRLSSTLGDRPNR